MTAEKCRKRGLFRTIAFGLALGVSFYGLTASAEQPPGTPRQPAVVAAPNAVLLPPVPSAELVSGVPDKAVSNALAGVGGPVSPTWCDPISRVPNFFGNFVARPSGVLVNQPRISTVTTETLTYFGLPNDIAGGTGRVNTFYPPFEPNGFVGRGGPYQLTTNVTGFGISGTPDFSILDENAELTAKIKANFPGATYSGGTALLEPPFPVMFEYLLTTTNTVPGLVALVNLPNPSGGGLVGRNKYFDDGSPIPRDRVFFDYSHVGAFRVRNSAFDINRYVVGAEKTFFNGFGSIEVRAPFAGTANSDQNGRVLEVNHTEFGNVGLLLKGTLFRNANWIVSAGMGVSMPTADDSRVLFREKSVLEIRNDAWLLQPIVGAAWAPNDRFYAQTGLQFDFDPSGNPVYVRRTGGEFSQRGVLRDQTYLYASGAVGYWLYQCDTAFLSGVSLQGELHFTRTLGDRDFVQTGSVLVADLNSKINVLNATTGVNILLGDRTNLGVGVSFPLSGDRQYDWNLMARLNVRFGSVSR